MESRFFLANIAANSVVLYGFSILCIAILEAKNPCGGKDKLTKLGVFINLFDIPQKYKCIQCLNSNIYIISYHVVVMDSKSYQIYVVHMDLSGT